MTFPIRSAGYPMAEWDTTIDRWNVRPPDSVVEGDFGDLIVEVGAVWDVTVDPPVRTTPGTFYTSFRGVPTVRGPFSWGEPFGELNGSLRLPAVQVFDDVSALFPRLVDVDVWRQLPAAEATAYGDHSALGYPTGCAPYWHGFVSGTEEADGPGVGGGVTVGLLGAMFGEISLASHQPQFYDPTPANDVGTWLAQALDRPGHSRPYTPFVGFRFTSATTGITSRHRGSRGDFVDDYCEAMLGQAQTASVKWTIGRQFATVSGRQYPVARAYELREVAASDGVAEQVSVVFAGGFGVGLSLSTDYTEAPNAVYGEGIARDGSRYRNARYPQLTTTAPAYPDRALTSADYPLVEDDDDSMFNDPSITQLNAQLRLAGWPDVEIGDTFTEDTAAAIVALKTARGWANVDPEIEDDAAWDLCWETGTGTTDYSSGFFMALAEASEATAYEYAADGDVLGPNAGYAGVKRVEQMVSFPDRVPKSRAAVWARRVVADSAAVPSIGTVALTADPTLDGGALSRLGVREGQWLQVNNLANGTFRSFHIAGVQVSPDARKSPASLTVGWRAFSLLDLSTRIERNRAAKADQSRNGAAMRTRVHRPWRDSVGWDRESGAGVVAPHAHPGGEWIVSRLIGAQRGQIDVIKATASPATEYALALFGADLSDGTYTTAENLVTYLTALIPDPLADEPDSYGWFNHPDNEDALESYGIINAWGSFLEPCGYGRGSKQSDPPATLSGKFLDDAPASFSSDDPPWLWLAEWCVDPVDSLSVDMRVIVEE